MKRRNGAWLTSAGSVLTNLISVLASPFRKKFEKLSQFESAARSSARSTGRLSKITLESNIDTCDSATRNSWTSWRLSNCARTSDAVCTVSFIDVDLVTCRRFVFRWSLKERRASLAWLPRSRQLAEFADRNSSPEDDVESPLKADGDVTAECSEG